MKDKRCLICNCYLSIYNKGILCFPCNRKPFDRTFEFKVLVSGKMKDGEKHFIDREQAILWYGRKKRISRAKAVKAMGGSR